MNHIYRKYENLGIAVCVNCTQFQHDIEAIDHEVFEHGYCDPPQCPRCQAEVCVPVPAPCIEMV